MVKDTFQAKIILLLAFSSTTAFVSRTPSTNKPPLIGTTLDAASPDFFYDVEKLPNRKGVVLVTRKETEYNLHYQIFRPMTMSSRQAAPLLVLHGGPSLPSDYLLPLAKVVPYRSIIFFDQIGCGASDEPKDTSCYSISQAVDDLQVLLKKLSIRQFHLYGQSFGGVLAYEYVRRVAEEEEDSDAEECLSLVLSSTPSSIPKSYADYDRLLAVCGDPESFRKTHQCRTPELPAPLARAYAKAGTIWGGLDVVADYVAEPLSDPTKLPSCMQLLGEYDFVIDPGWKDLWSKRFRKKKLPGCSHHGLLENPPLYGDLLDAFFAEYDP